MHKEDIKTEIRKRHGSMAAFADEVGAKPVHIRQALANPYPKIQRLIADDLGKTVHELWPFWYDKDGSRKRTKVTDNAAITNRKPARRDSKQPLSSRESARGTA